ncbi:TIGR04013 family B12-binding domain/radical SAM domain-containing protein [Pyrobaculum sp. 3827-6]|uniref:TIGR04013 family B12-binding domain/radical SAM domain-containing protein n=1 Tax=Pyrobaculum sp. 3827-6 TaxID=2983604 RepID=UPI0021D9F0C5|nr:TIGR04013 family B12-binding domain/radical SAM domain-containing protein [Pyrobaculum sp. 3827-6]MCU7787068.1 TIGR04013 family B12-binding domain/radical SAM domain-containing protein [Pyrobaculum sp. 3827-6]
MIILARVFEGPNNGLAYALAPIEDRYKVVTTKNPYEDAAALVSKGERVVVLYSLSTPTFVEVWQEIAVVARRFPVAAGGPHAMGDPLTLLRLGVKYVVVGDGEAALPAILDREERHSDETPPNVLTVEDGVLRAGRRVFVELTHRTYSKALGVYPPIEIARSCGYRCAFCQTWMHGPVRYRPLENVAQIVRTYVGVGRREIRFIAPVGFLYQSSDGKTPNVEALVALLKAVREAGGLPYLGTFPSETRPETVTRDVLSALRSLLANKRISFGLQTASERLLRLTKRGHDVSVVEEAVATARAFGFTPVVDVIAGLPGEEEEDVATTVREMEKLIAMGARIRMHYYVPLPGTPLWLQEPRPPHRLYQEFVKRWRKKVEGYWEEQMALGRRILETYREIGSYLSRTTPSSTAS